MGCLTERSVELFFSTESPDLSIITDVWSATETLAINLENFEVTRLR